MPSFVRFGNGSQRSGIGRVASVFEPRFLIAVLGLLALSMCLVRPASATIAYVQGAGLNPHTGSSVSVTFAAAQTAGNFNVVTVAWDDTTSTVVSITDTNGNAYVLAGTPTTISGTVTQKVYYATNIGSAAAGANTVTVLYSNSVMYPEVKIAEYSGISTTSPLDGMASGTGTGTAIITGSLTTTNANDLLVAADVIYGTSTAGDPNYTSRDTVGGDLEQDRIVSAVGTYTASDTQTPSSWWLIQLVAFKAASGAVPTTPTALTVTPYSSSVNILNWGASTSSAGVKNYPVQRCSGSGCSSFAQIAAVTSPGYVDSGLTSGTSYAYRVQAQDVAGNVSSFSGTSSATPTLQAGSVSYAYDTAARLVSAQYGTAETMSYGLDAAGNRTQVTAVAPAPGSPGVPSVTGITATAATASWTAASGTVTFYQYSLNSGAWTSVGTALTVNLSGLSAGTTYTLQVQAVNDGSVGTASSASFITALSAPGVPIFTNLTATAATATWTAASGNSVTSYQYSVNSGAWSSVGTALRVNLSGLTPVTAYTVQVRAVNANGPGPASSASVTTLPGTPGVPSFTGITATTATVSWTAASGTVTSYAYRVNSGAWTTIGTALTVTLSGLTSATAYTVQVQAVNSGSAGAASSASFTTLPGAPGAPSFTSLTATAATMSWTAASGTITQYQYSVNSGAWTSAGTALTVNLIGLSPATAYTVQVRAGDVTGAGAASSGSFTTLTPIPSAPGTPSFSNITTTTATVTWTAPSGSVTSYEYSVNAGAWTNTGTVLTANLSGLTSATSYTVAVHAINAGGTGPVSSATFSTLTVAGAPGTPSFSNIAATTATVSWTAASGGVTSYAYSVNGAAWTNVGTALTVNLTGLTAGTNYTVQVEAINAGGSGPASTGTLLTLPGAPGVPSTSNITTTTATATWTAPPGIVTSYDYRLEYSLDAGQTWTSVGTAVTVVLTGLTPGTAYSVQVHAVNSSGAGAPSTAGFTTEPPSPGTPSFTNITPTAATVSWAPASGIVASYQYSVNSGAWTNVGAALTVNLTGLTQLTGYTVQVQAVNVSGAGPASSAAFTTLPSLPGPPGAPSFSNITPTTTTVVWPAASGTVASYQYGINSGGWVNVGTALTVNLSGLAPLTNYTVQVQAVNVTGPSAASSAGFTTAPSLPGSPGAPSFSNITGTTATTSWGAASGTVASYQYSVNSGAWTSVGTALSANLSGLTDGTRYTVQVQAVNVTGPGTASSAAFTTLDTAPPSAPGVPTVSNLGSTTVTVTWPPATDNVGVTNYAYQVTSAAGSSGWTSVGNVLTANLAGLVGVTQYSVSVRANDAAGNIGQSTTGAPFTTLVYTDTPVMTQGEWDNDGTGHYLDMGLELGYGGSMSPATTTNGYTYQAFFDGSYSIQAGEGYKNTKLVISGFTADPGQAWLTSAGPNGSTLLGSAASNYTYSAGTSTWVWTTGPYFAGSGTTTCTIIHK